MPLGNSAHDLLLRLAPHLYMVLAHSIFKSCRTTHTGPGYGQFMAARSQPIIILFWHYSTFYVPYICRHVDGVAMVSSSKDGEYVARILQRLGYGTVRGSRNQLGVSALKNLIGAMAAGKTTALVADGSQGPPLQLQPGVVLLASKSRQPIIPITMAASRYLAFNSWDRTIVPAPFAKILTIYGEPLFVPAGLRQAEAIEAERQRLERLMVAQYRENWQKMGRDRH